MKTKEKCVAELCWIATRQGAFQRSYIYCKSATDENKEKVRKTIRKYLTQDLFGKVYMKEISESFLYETIAQIISIVEEGNRDTLLRQQFQWGNAQKFVNLFIKNMWLVGAIKKNPPHFPVDGIMIKKLGLDRQGYKWTDMDRDNYNTVINVAREIVKGSIAEWEAVEWLNTIEDKNRA